MLQTRQHRKSPAAALGHHRRRGVHRKRRPQLRGVAEALEARPHDADDRVGASGQRQFAPDDSSIGAEPPSPEPVADDDHGNRFGDEIFLGQKCPPPSRHRAEKREVRRRHELRVDPLGLTAVCERHRLAVERRHVLEAPGLRAPIEIIGIRGAAALHLRAQDVAPQFHQPLRVVVRQRPRANGVHETEDGGVAADADGKRQHRHRGERRRLAQPAQREPHVLPHAFERREKPHIEAPLF